MTYLASASEHLATWLNTEKENMQCYTCVISQMRHQLVTAVIFLFIYFMCCLAVQHLKLMSEYPVKAQQIYFRKWSIMDIAVILHLIYVCQKSTLQVMWVMDTDERQGGRKEEDEEESTGRKTESLS